MKKLATVLIVLQVTFSLAQVRPGGQRPQGRSQNAPNRENIKFEASKVAGILKFDSDEILKKLKIKEADSIFISVTKAVETYNHNIEEIALLNKDLLDGLDLVVNETTKSGANNQEAIFEIRKRIKVKLKPVRDSIKIEDEKLSSVLKSILDEKQFEKWEKYEKLERGKLMPKRQEQTRPNTPNRSSTGAGFGGGNRNRN